MNVSLWTADAFQAGVAMRDAGREYFIRRLRQCLELADRATDSDIANVHREFAKAYKKQLQASGTATLHLIDPE